MGQNMMKRCILARYTDTTNPDDQRFLYGPSVSFSTVDFVSSDLQWVTEKENLVRLDISCNYLCKIDLSPLADCKSLKYLDLSENAIEEIDLIPLQTCENLETLDLSYNRLSDVNLLPLVKCKSLKYVYLHQNRLDTINIAPLHHLCQLEKVIIDNLHASKPIPVYGADYDSAPPNLNDVLYAMSFKTDRPEWLYGCPDVQIIRMNPDSYATHVKKHGWKSVCKHLKVAQTLIHPRDDFAAQQAILTDLGLSELACYDGSISDIVDIFPRDGTYEEGVLEIQAELISMLQKQIEKGGSTLFFDIDQLATTPGSVLVPSIVTRREQELQNLILYQHEGRVNLMPMWLTGFGFNILKAAGYGQEASPTLVPEILERFAADTGISISLKKTTSKRKYESLQGKPSKPLLDHLKSLVSKSSILSST